MPGPPPISPRRSLAAALLAGTVHGPAEALPVSSSAHVAFVARLASGRRGRRPADPEVAKGVEIGAHAGTLAGLAVGLRREALTAVRGAFSRPRLAGRTVAQIAVASLPAVVGALTLERPIERHLGGDATIAVGLVVGSVAMAAADRRGTGPGGCCTPSTADGDQDGGPTTTDAETDRRWEDATFVDALLVGTAQATALWPGISRSGAVLAAARGRGFSRGAAGEIAAALAVPVVGGATLLKLVRLGGRLRAGTIGRQHVVPLAAVTVTGGLSGYLAAPLARRTLDGLPLAPFAVYRVGLAAALVAADRRWRR